MDFKVSTRCPIFVQLQGDQVFCGKIMKSDICPGFVLQLFHGFRSNVGDKCWTKAAKRVNIGCNEDKIWVFKPNPSQILSKDKIKTRVRHLLDIFLVLDKTWTKIGGPTLYTSTSIAINLNSREVAEELDSKHAKVV